MNSASHTPPRPAPIAICIIGGQDIELCKSANEALLFTLRELYKIGGDRFMIALADKLKKGERRNHLARTKAEVYPIVNSLDHQVRKVVPYWWIGLNCNNAEKEKWVETACSLLGKTYGRGRDVWVKWAVPLPAGFDRASLSVRELE